MFPPPIITHPPAEESVDLINGATNNTRQVLEEENPLAELDDGVYYCYVRVGRAG